MTNLIKKWLEFARDDLRAAQILFDKRAYKESIYHCHQAIEKFLKAAIVAKNGAARKSHDLPDLLKASGSKYTKEILEFILRLNPYYNPIRYPDAAAPFLRYDKKTAGSILKLTKEVSKWLIFQTNQKE